MSSAFPYRQAIIFSLLIVSAHAAPASSLGGWRTKTLANGLQVYIFPDRTVDVVTVHVTYLVGAATDYPGSCGRAHLLEHMMFRGTTITGSGEFGLWITRVGGELQGSTGPDRTVYYETLPAADLELALYLEADRMRGLSLSPEDLESEKGAVSAEAMTKSNIELQQVRGIAAEHLIDEKQQQRCSVVGLPVDIVKQTVQTIRSFYDEVYTPRNALLTIVGNCKPGPTMKLVERYFATIPSQSEINATHSTGTIPSQERNKLLFIEKGIGQGHGIYICFNLGSPVDTKWYTALILGRWLADGDDSVFYQRMLRGDHKAVTLRFSVQPRKAGTIGTIYVGSAQDTNDVLIQQTKDVILKLSTLRIEPQRLTRLKQLTENELSEQWSTTFGKADTLSQASALYGYVYRLDDALQHLRTVTAFDVEALAKSMSHAEFIDMRPTAVIGPSGKVQVANP